MRPISKHQVGGDRSQVFEEAICSAAGGDSISPGRHGEIRGGVEGEGQQIERQKGAGQGPLAVTKVVLKIVAVVLEHLKVSFSTFHRARPQAAVRRRYRP